METEAVLCNVCAAPLQIPEEAQYVTCVFCHANLAVKRNDTIIFTEKLEQIHQTTKELAQQVAVLNHQSELIQLDQEWEQERKTYFTRGRAGVWREPSVRDSWIQIGGFIVFEFISMTFLFVAGPSAQIFPLFLLTSILIVIVILFSIRDLNKAKNYERAFAYYEERRMALESKNAANHLSKSLQTEQSKVS